MKNVESSEFGVCPMPLKSHTTDSIPSNTEDRKAPVSWPWMRTHSFIA